MHSAADVGSWVTSCEMATALGCTRWLSAERRGRRQGSSQHCTALRLASERAPALKRAGRLRVQVCRAVPGGVWASTPQTGERPNHKGDYPGGSTGSDACCLGGRRAARSAASSRIAPRRARLHPSQRTPVLDEGALGGKDEGELRDAHGANCVAGQERAGRQAEVMSILAWCYLTVPCDQAGSAGCASPVPDGPSSAAALAPLLTHAGLVGLTASQTSGCSHHAANGPDGPDLWA